MERIEIHVFIGFFSRKHFNFVSNFFEDVNSKRNVVQTFAYH